MNVQEWLNQVAHIVTSDLPDDDGKVYVSKFNDSFITRVGMEDDSLLKFLAEHGVTDELTHGVGFSPSEQKWYGWSHRAIYGFSIGATCKKGDCHYCASTMDDEVEKAAEFWSDPAHIDLEAVYVEEDDNILVSWTYSDDPELVPNKSLHGKSGSSVWHGKPDKKAKGEWTAETLKDAKQMAIDFNEGVS